MNTGLPGPPIPGEVQNPIHLDRVCVRFPELRLCMIHGADPWWDVAIRLLIKYQNLRLMTSAWSPKRLPLSLLHYMRTRGPGKVIFASDYPVLRQQRVVPEALAPDLPTEVLQKYLHDNAKSFSSAPARLRRRPRPPSQPRWAEPWTATSCAAWTTAFPQATDDNSATAYDHRDTGRLRPT